MKAMVRALAETPLWRLREGASEDERELFESRGRWWWARMVLSWRLVVWLMERGVTGWKLSVPEAILLGHWRVVVWRMLQERRWSRS